MLYAQETTTDSIPNDSIQYWKKGAAATINFSQVTFSNWAAGGENSYSLSGLTGMFANYKKRKTSWDNTLDIGYGIIKQEGYKVRKSDDKIDFMSKFGHNAKNRWYYSAILNFKTQIDRGYKYESDPISKILISDRFSPAYITLSAGMEYKTNDGNFYILISPVTGKTTIVTNDSLKSAGAFGVEAGQGIRHEFGGMIKTAYKKEIFENVVFQAKVDLFSNYMENPQNIDVNIETLFTMKINKFLATSIMAQIIYDDDIMITDAKGKTGPRTQFKEVLAIGLSYKFGD
ncbi:MAG: DUF3078 domain-containing protein [Bacteroidales bacterium]|nr:DUF3078 domain-containing protein [Bacteroidales bacterium]